MGLFSGAGCFSDLQTEWIYKDGIDILSNPGSATMMNINAIGDIALNFGGYLSEFAVYLPELGNYIPELVAMGEVGLFVFAPPVAVTLAGIFTACFMFDYCVDQGWLPPERCREILGLSPPFAIINLFMYHEPNSLYSLLEAAQKFRLYVKDNLDKIEGNKNYNIWPPIPPKKPDKQWEQTRKDEQEQMEEFVRESSKKNRETIDRGITLKDPKLIAAGLGGFALTTSIAALYAFGEQMGAMVNDFITQCQIIYKIILPESNSTNNNTTT